MGTGLEEKIVKTGTKIELRPDELHRDESGNQKAVYYGSRITDVREDGGIEAYMPIDHGKLVLLQVGGRLDICFYTAGGMYECRAVVLERYQNGGLYFVVLRMTSELKRNQRREYYRYKCTLSMKDRRMESAECKWMAEKGQLIVMDELPMEKSTIVDLSGGGMQFVSEHRYEVGSIVYGTFCFGKEYHMCLRILDVAGVTDRQGEYRHRAKYIGISEKDREEIIQHIFALERMKRKNDQDL